MVQSWIALSVALVLVSSCSQSNGSTNGDSLSTIQPPEIPAESFEMIDGEPCWEGVCRPTIYGATDTDSFLVASEDFASELMVVWVPPDGSVQDSARFVAEDGQIGLPAIHESGTAMFVRTPAGSTRFVELVNGDSRCSAEGGTTVTRFVC